MSTECTPKSQATKKRELTSPEFEVDLKKNRYGSLTSESESESDLNSSETERLDSSHITSLTKSSDMASGSDLGSSEALMDTSHSQDQSASAPHIMIPPSEMQKISEMLKLTFRGEIESMVETIVKGVLTGLQDRISSVEKINSDLVNENIALKTRLTSLEAQCDQAEQYSRRNCLRISGIKEESNENTDDIVLKIASDIGSDLQLPNIDRSHRIGNPNKTKGRPRDIIVKFATYRSRSNFYRHRKLLKENGHVGVFVNEDLTKRRSGILYEARTLFKSKQIEGAWSSDGTILIKDNTDNVHRIISSSDLDPFRGPQISAGAQRRVPGTPSS